MCVSCLGVRGVSYSELFFDWTRVGLGVQSVHLVVNRTKLIGWDGGVTAETRLQDGVMDEDVLLLERLDTPTSSVTRPHPQ